MSNLNGTVNLTPVGDTIRTYRPTVTSSMKWWMAISLAILFFLIASPVAYNFTNAVWTSIGLPSLLNGPGCPNILGVFVHAIVFAIIVRILLW